MERGLGEIFEFEDYFKKEKIKLKVVDEIQLGKCLDTHREYGKNIVFKKVDSNV